METRDIILFTRACLSYAITVRLPVDRENFPLAASNTRLHAKSVSSILITVIFSGATALLGLGRRRSAKLVQTFADRGVSRGQCNGSPPPLISVYRTWIATYFIQVAP